MLGLPVLPLCIGLCWIILKQCLCKKNPIVSNVHAIKCKIPVDLFPRHKFWFSSCLSVCREREASGDDCDAFNVEERENGDHGDEEENDDVDEEEDTDDADEDGEQEDDARTPRTSVTGSRSSLGRHFGFSDLFINGPAHCSVASSSAD